MSFGAFALISLFYCVIGVRVAIQVARSRRDLFDARFTMEDRALITQAAFFLLVPVSVALHELGHAVAIWAYGGEVIDFGFYFYAGFVSYREPFDAAQQTVVAAAGPLVNLLLCALAVAVVFLKRPPFRAPVNELLLQFALISGINAFIFYPLLDFATGLGGDYSQMYSFDAPALSLAILAVHVAIVAVGVWAWRSPAFKRRIARLTGLPAGVDRTVFGGFNAQTRRPAARSRHGEAAAPIDETFPPSSPLGRAAATLTEAGQRVGSGWSTPVRVAVAPLLQETAGGPRPSGVAIALDWTSAGDSRGRQVIARYLPSNGLRLAGQSGGRTGDDGPARSGAIASYPELPAPDDLVLALRLAMEEVDRWQVVAAPV